MRVIGIIPARSGSKAVKNKNIKQINNMPLIYWTINTALKSKLDEVIVSTDSRKIKKICEKYGAKVPFIRPLRISKDNSKSIDVVKHALKFYEKKNIFYDAVLLLQPTCPLRTVQDINKSLKILKKEKILVQLFHFKKLKAFTPHE